MTSPTTTTPPKERPILFSAPTVRALLAGTKTQTRRIINPQPDCTLTSLAHTGYGPVRTIAMKDGRYSIFCPQGQPGDRLWVKETWATAPNFDKRKPTDLSEGIVILHRANQGATGGKWRPSIFMRRWMSRITLEITEIRVQRLQDLSEEDAIAEGIETGERSYGTAYRDYRGEPGAWFTDPIASYRSLWESINGPGSWDANPYVWAITFRRLFPEN